MEKPVASVGKYRNAPNLGHGNIARLRTMTMVGRGHGIGCRATGTPFLSIVGDTDDESRILSVRGQNLKSK